MMQNKKNDEWRAKSEEENENDNWKRMIAAKPIESSEKDLK